MLGEQRAARLDDAVGDALRAVLGARWLADAVDDRAGRLDQPYAEVGAAKIDDDDGRPGVHDPSRVAARLLP